MKGDNNRLNIIFDATILRNGQYDNTSRTGIHSVAYNVLKEFFLKKDINIYLYNININDFLTIFGQDIMKTNKANIYFVNEYKYEKFISFTEKLKAEKKRAKLKKKILYKLLLQIILIFLSPAAKKLKNIKQNVLKYNNKNNIFFSPVFKIPEQFDKCKKYTLLHDTIPLIFPEYFNYTAKDWFIIMINSINSQDNYFTNSDCTKKDFFKYCPQINPNKIHTTLLACNENFKPAYENEIIKKVKEKYNIPTDKKYIFSLCTLEPRKNLIRSVKTFIEFIKKNNIEDLVFVLGGCYWESFIEKLENEIGNLGEYKDKIIRAGYVDDEDLAPLYTGAQWFVYTSQYEGFGLPPLEAMSCGCPVITSNNSSLPEVVGDSGIMIDYDSDEQHIEAYEKYYFNEEVRKEFSKKGLERAKQFSWKKCADEMLSVMLNEN